MVFPDGCAYVPVFLDGPAHDELLAQIRELDFVHDRFYGKPLKRAYAQFGAEYVSTGRKLVSAPPFPPFLSALVQYAMVHCPGGAGFDQCIVTRYPVGAGIGWHTDADRFGDTILGVSLAGDAKLRFRLKGAEKHTHELTIAPGDLYVMQGPARWEYEHQIVPVKAERYSLTFRTLRKES